MPFFSIPGEKQPFFTLYLFTVQRGLIEGSVRVPRGFNEVRPSEGPRKALERPSEGPRNPLGSIS